MQAFLFLTALAAASAVDCRKRTIPDFLCLLTAAAGLISFSPAQFFGVLAALPLLIAALIFAFGVPQWIWRQLQQRGLPQRAGAAAAAVGYSALFGVTVLTLAGATFNPFIYFQF